MSSMDATAVPLNLRRAVCAQLAIGQRESLPTAHAGLSAVENWTACPRKTALGWIRIRFRPVLMVSLCAGLAQEVQESSTGRSGHIRTLPPRRPAIREGDHTLQSVIAFGASLNAGKERPPAPRASPRFPLDSRRCLPKDEAHLDADPCGVTRSGKAITLCKV